MSARLAQAVEQAVQSVKTVWQSEDGRALIGDLSTARIVAYTVDAREWEHLLRVCREQEAEGAYRKTTVLEGVYASGDFECFCFDKVADPWDDERPYEQRNAERVYPDDLLPDGPPGPRYGDWTVTIEFVPRTP